MGFKVYWFILRSWVKFTNPFSYVIFILRYFLPFYFIRFLIDSY